MEQIILETPPSTVSSQIKERKRKKRPNITDAGSSPGDMSSGKSMMLVGNGTDQIVHEMMLSHENQKKKPKKRKNSIPNPGDISSGKNIVLVGSETEPTVLEMKLSPENQRKKSKKRKRSKTRNNSISNPDDVSPSKDIVLVGNENAQNVLETALSHEKRIKKSKKRKRSKKGKDSISIPVDVSLGKDIVLVGNETEQTVLEMTLPHEKQRKKSKKRNRSKRGKNSISNPDDVSSGKDIVLVGNEAEETVSEAMLTNENQQKKSKKRKKSKKKKDSLSNADSNCNLEDISSSALLASDTYNQEDAEVSQSQRKENRKAQSTHLDREAADSKVKGGCSEDKTSSTSSFLEQSYMSSEQRIVKLPSLVVKRAGHARRKLLILDLNGLLADIVSCPEPTYKPDRWISRKAVFKRPFCDDFLEFCFETFDVGVWTSRKRNNMWSAIDFLMGDKRKRLLFCWDQDHCTKTGYQTIENEDKPLFLKEIKKLWDNVKGKLPWNKGDYNEFNTLLIDDSPSKALCNRRYTGIFPNPYVYKDIKDNSLGPDGELRLYLKRLAAARNVRTFVKNNPFGQQPITSSSSSWAFYSKVVDAIGSMKKQKKMFFKEKQEKGDGMHPHEPTKVSKLQGPITRARAKKFGQAL